MSFNIPQGVQAVAHESGADNSMAHLPGNNIVEIDCYYRRNIVVRIRIVRVGGAECRAGKKQHQAKHHTPQITMP
jgi:hypothetical protein